MNVTDYANQIDQIMTTARLTPQEKRAALELTAEEIQSCAWQGHAKTAAREQVGIALLNAAKYPDGGLEALDSLAKKGFLARR